MPSNSFNMKCLTRLAVAGVGGLLALAAALPGRAQVPAAPAAAPTTDVILRLDGTAVAGRVLLITPTELRYLPAPPTGPDTLRLPVAEVFLVRFANGTREVLTRPAAPADAAPNEGRLTGLSGAERQRLGRTDAQRCYEGRGVFWQSAGLFLLGGPGLIGLAVSASRPVPPHRLAAPQPHLLLDPDYSRTYQQEADRIKRRQMWRGAGTSAAVVLGVALTIAAGER